MGSTTGVACSSGAMASSTPASSRMASSTARASSVPRAPCLLPPASCRLPLAAPCAHALLCAYALGAWHAVAPRVACTVSRVKLRHRVSWRHRPRPPAQLLLTPRCGRGESRVAGQPVGAGAVRGLLQGRPQARLRPRGCAAQARQIRQRLPRRCASSLPRAPRRLLAPRPCFHVIKQAFWSRVRRCSAPGASVLHAGRKRPCLLYQGLNGRLLTAVCVRQSARSTARPAPASTSTAPEPSSTPHRHR
jgi:hypothetical protein